MEFESAKKTAERLGVNIRTVQKWAKENKFEGACRLGREWLIPKDALPLKNPTKQRSGITLCRFFQIITFPVIARI